MCNFLSFPWGVITSVKKKVCCNQQSTHTIWKSEVSNRKCALSFKVRKPRWLGRRKFAIPSLIMYSWPQFPHANLPSITWVSRSNRCKSLSVCSLLSASPSGLVSGIGGKPSCRCLSAQYIKYTQVIEGKVKYLISCYLQCTPVNPGYNITYELCFEIQFLQFQFGIVEVKWKRCWQCLATLDSTGHEIDGNHFHFCWYGVPNDR